MDDAIRAEIWRAPAGGGKTLAALELYRRVLAAGDLRLADRRRGLWLAPARAAAAEVRDALAAGGQAFLDPGVTTFAGFAAEVVWDAGLRVREVSTLERRRVLRQVIDAAVADGVLPYFGRVAETPGLVLQVDEAIAGLKRRDISVDAFLRSGRGASPRERDLAELYRRYEQRLAAGGLVDGEGLFLAAREGARSVAEVGSGLELVVVDGFTDFSPAQLGILRVLAERAQRMVVTLVGNAEGRMRNGEGGRPEEATVGTRGELFAKTQATWRALLEMGAQETECSPAPRPPSPIPSLQHLERNLFRSYGEVEPSSAEAKRSLGNIEVVAASSVQGEITEIARRVKRLLLDGARPGDVVVTFRSTKSVDGRVRQAFDDYGIPVHLDVPPRLGTTAVVRSLLGLLRLHVEDWPYRRLLQVIGDRSLAIFDTASELEPWQAPADARRMPGGRTAVELCVRHAQLPAGRRALLEQVAVWAADETGLAAVEGGVAARGQAILLKLAEVFDELPARAGVAEWVEAIEGLGRSLDLLSGRVEGASYPLPGRSANSTALRTGDFGSPVLGCSHPLKGEGAGQDALRDWLALIGGLKSITRLDESTGAKGRKLAANEFVDLIATIAGEVAAPGARDATGRVRVLSADAARFTRPRHLVVGGLSEQAFAESRRGSGVVAEEELGEDGGESGGDGGEMLLFYQLVTRTTETLTLSYPALDAKAQAMPASPLLVELKRCFDGALEETVQELGYNAPQGGASLSRSELRRSAVGEALSRKRELLAGMGRSPRFWAIGRSVLDGIEAVASRGSRQGFGAFEGQFSTDAVRAVLERKYGSDYLWSPSKLETYAACPFRFFAENVLSLAEAPELILESDLARRGSVLHDTLARLYARITAAAEAGGPAPTPAAVAQQFQETLDAIAGSRPRRGLEGALREVERRQIAAWAEKFSQQHDDYGAAWRHLDAPLVPTYFEARFGPKHRKSESLDDESLSTEKPFELTVGEETLRFTGQIDRIDVGRMGDGLVFNVIDYKTSASVRLKPDDVKAGLQIQLPLYAMAAAELLLADKQAAALSAGYWSIRGKGFAAGARSGGPLAIGEIRDGKVEIAAGWTELRQELLARITEIVGGIRRGAFPVFNADPHCGQHCPYSTGCRISHVRSLEKTWPAAQESSGSLPLKGRGPEQ